MRAGGNGLDNGRADMTSITLRDASPEDARVLAELMNMAGVGIPAYLWALSTNPGIDLMEFGATRARRTEGSFSFRHACVAEVEGSVAGMLLGYPLIPSSDRSIDTDEPEIVRPLSELEAIAGDCWYVNAVATFATYGGRGVGTLLMRHAEVLARTAGAGALALIVAGQNQNAVRLYVKLGYQTVAARAVIPFPGFPHGGDWLLMKKPMPHTQA